MSDYLIALAIGPVQDFISAAHKTRDLWFGSHLLSEVSKAAAKSLKTQGAKLIFPAPEHREKDLEPSEDQEGFNVANKLLVKVTTDNPGAIAEKAKQAACARWQELANNALDKIGKNNIRNEVWNAQVDDVLETFAAWVLINNDYAKARQNVERLLAARKVTRDFGPAPNIKQSLPKSSLDAARETVLQKNLNIKARYQLNLSPNEQLDCPGVVKRVGGKAESFPAITRIALETWFSTLLKNRDEKTNNALDDIDKAYQSLKSKQMATAVTGYKILPFDCGLLFPERIDVLKREIKGDANLPGLKDLEGFESVESELKAIKNALEPLYKKHGNPLPYFAILVADGDKMGELLGKCKELKEHQDISRQLAAFAEAAKTIVKNHSGAPVYTGGDDVLALLPVHTAVQCADELRQRFSAELDGKATLSVGLGIAHIFTPFTLAMDLGRRAEKLAKNGAKDLSKAEQRNALGIILDVRSGSELQLRGRWDSGIVDALTKWQSAYQKDQLPGGLPYDLQEAVRRMEWAKNNQKVDYLQVVTQEITRVLTKKRAEAGTKKLDDKMISKITGAIAQRDVDTVLKQLRLARWLAGKLERGA